jgi:hypothetical protein
MILLTFHALALACRGHRELVLENMALRQQRRTFKRTTKRPRLRTRYRLFWDCVGQRVAALAYGVGVRPAGDGPAMAS